MQAVNRTYEVVYKSKSGREEKATEEIRTTLNAWECKYWLFDTYCKRLDVAEVVSVIHKSADLCYN